MRSRRRKPDNGLVRQPIYPNRLRQMRQARGLTQRDVARYLGHVTVDYYRDLEHGKRFPRLENLATLAIALSATLWDLYPQACVDAQDRVRRVDERRTR